MGTTGQPAIVYLPSGTYLMSKSIQLFVGTVLMGNPLNPPILQATADFPDDHIVYGKDPNHDGTVNFYIAVKNLVIDSTKINPATSITLLDWTVSQATQLTNVVFSKTLTLRYMHFLEIDQMKTCPTIPPATRGSQHNTVLTATLFWYVFVIELRPFRR